MTNIKKEDAHILSAILIWAYKHGIKVSLRREYPYQNDGIFYPVIEFYRDGKHIYEAFFSLTDIKGGAEYLWKKVGMALCVEEPQWLEEKLK